MHVHIHIALRCAWAFCHSGACRRHELRCAIAHRRIHTPDHGYGFRVRRYAAPRN